MAPKQKQAKMANRNKGGAEATTRRNYTVAGSPLTGYVILNVDGEPVDDEGGIDLNVMTGEVGPGQKYENMWDAINKRKEFDSGTSS